jgi:hypothetical protein
MSEDPTSEDEQPEVDDGTLSEVVRRPTRTAGDLSEVADASPGITTKDLARDLEAVASKRGVPTDSELLANLLERVKRIEEQLGIGGPEVPLEPRPLKRGDIVHTLDQPPSVPVREFPGHQVAGEEKPDKSR